MADHCHNAALRHAASFHSALLPYSKPHNTTCDTRSRGNGGGGGTGLVGADGEVGRGQRRGPEPVRARDRRAAVRGRVGVPDAGVGPPVRGRERDGGEGGGHDQGVRVRAHVHENVNVDANVSSPLRSGLCLSFSVLCFAIAVVSALFVFLGQYLFSVECVLGRSWTWTLDRIIFCLYFAVVRCSPLATSPSDAFHAPHACYDLYPVCILDDVLFEFFEVLLTPDNVRHDRYDSTRPASYETPGLDSISTVHLIEITITIYLDTRRALTPALLSVPYSPAIWTSKLIVTLRIGPGSHRAPPTTNRTEPNR